MLETSIDLLWIALALVILWIGFWIGWGAFYLAMILGDIKKITGSVKKKLDIIDEILDLIKKKVEKTANYLPPLIDGVGKLMAKFKDKKEKKTTKASKKK